MSGPLECVGLYPDVYVRAEIKLQTRSCKMDASRLGYEKSGEYCKIALYAANC